MINRASIFAFALLGGFFIVTGLLLSISLLASYRTHAKEQQPLLIVDLMQWPTPVQPTVQEKTVPKPQKKRVEKTASPPKPRPEPASIAKKIVAERAPEPEPVEAVDVHELTPVKTPSPMKAKATEEQSLPTPVPIFQLTQAPRFLHREAPVYPEVMRVQGVSGVVKLEALIDKKGRVRKVHILKSVGKAFDEAAKRAILASSFYPAKVKNRPVAVLLRLPVKFNLQ